MLMGIVAEGVSSLFMGKSYMPSLAALRLALLQRI